MKTRHVLIWFICPLLLGSLAAPSIAYEGEDVSIRVTPQVCAEGSNVRITVRIDPDPDNRMLTIEADSPSYFRSSKIQLPGDRAALLHTLLLRSLPSGSYDVRATVTRADGETHTAPAELRVVGAPGFPG